ncbi:MAG: sulfotransferase [Gammaproteobacteria bacterium]
MRERVERVRHKELFFIGGTMKAGTTWLQLMLNAHPEISCQGEGHFTNVLIPGLVECYSRYTSVIEDKNRSIFQEIEGFPLPVRNHLHYVGAVAMLLLMSEYGDSAAIKLVGEKTPDNIRALPMLHLVFPRARFINIIRDGRDVAVSAWFHNLRVSPEWAMKNFGSLERFSDHYASIWQREVETAHIFAKANPGRVLEMTYEKLHDDGRNEMARVLTFLGADDSEASLERCLTAGEFKRLTKGRQMGEEDRNSHFRKGVVGDWRHHMTEATAARFAEMTKGWLRDMGYE